MVAANWPAVGFEVAEIVGHLAGAAPQPGFGAAVQHVAAHLDNLLDQGPHSVSIPAVSGLNTVMVRVSSPVAPARDIGDGVERVRLGAIGLHLLEQDGLVVLQLDDEMRLRLGGRFEGFLRNTHLDGAGFSLLQHEAE